MGVGAAQAELLQAVQPGLLLRRTLHGCNGNLLVYGLDKVLQCSPHKRRLLNNGHGKLASGLTYAWRQARNHLLAPCRIVGLAPTLSSGLVVGVNDLIVHIFTPCQYILKALALWKPPFLAFVHPHCASNLKLRPQ